MRPMQQRLAASERRKRRYREDPGFRLAQINSRRRLEGRPLYRSVEEVPKRHSLWQEPLLQEGGGEQADGGPADDQGDPVSQRSLPRSWSLS